MGIAQDHQQFMWFATSRGLFRYDSQTFKQYSHDPGNPNSIASDYVRAVFCDTEGNLWVGTASGISVYNRDKDTFTNFRHDDLDTNSLSDNTIYFIQEDSRKRLWVGTSRGLNRLTMEDSQVKFSRFLQDEWEGPSRQIRCMAEGKNGALWLGTYDGLIRMEKDGTGARIFKMDTGSNYSLVNEFVAVYVDEGGEVWLGSNNECLIRFDTASERFSTVPAFRKENGVKPNVSGFVRDKQGKFWIITGSGLAHFDPVTHQVRWYVNRPENPYSLPDDVLYAIYPDKQGGLWLGSYYLGISYLHPDAPGFAPWPSPEGDNALGKEFLNGWMGRSKRENLWVISDDNSKMALFDKEVKGMSLFELQLPPSTEYYFFYVDGNDGLWGGGSSVLTRYDLKTRRHQDYPLLTSDKRDTPVRGKIYKIIEDRQDRFWIGGSFGLLLFDKKNGHFRKVGPVNYVTSIFEDSQSNLWVGGKDEVFLLTKGAEQLERLPVSKMEATGNTAYVRRIVEDPSGRIWIAALGLQRYDSERHQFVRYPENASLNYVLDVQSDRQGYLWINSESKLIRYHPDRGSVQTYGYPDGLPPNSILRISGSVEDKDGILYFTTNKGTFRFDPEKIVLNAHPSPIVITSLKLFNKEVGIGDQTGLLPREIGTMKELTFRHDQNIFTLSFALLSYKGSDKNQYRYKLDGFEKDWNTVAVPSATYTNLPPGDYTFMAGAANGDGYWNEEPLQIRIVVLPPWWKTWYAYLLYLVVSGIVVYGITRFFWLRSSFRKENELYQAKLDFFTNISHEIRTHLSLISGPLEKAFKSPAADTVTRNHLSYAKNSSERLMRLVNELLDFRKMQNGSIRLHVSEHNVVRVLENVLAAFEHLALEKGITTRMECPDKPVMLWFDSAQMQKVFYNLLSNAYKFTPEGGTVSVVVTEISNEVILKVIDNGGGIAPEHLGHLFTNFFQTYEGYTDNTGYGIGLALSKGIVGQHHGDLSVTSQLRNDSRAGGTCFTLRLLKGNRQYEAQQLTAASGPVYLDSGSAGDVLIPPGNNTDSTLKNTLLLIEDNDELRAFTREVFRESFQVLDAANGQDGLDLARKSIPDLILCDVMMPGLNGLEVCSRLKSDVLTSHIPIILLTARSTVPQVIEGLKTGADDYVVKPFDLSVLELKINNLIQVRESLKQQYSRSVLLEPDAIVLDDLEGEFIAKLKELVIQNLSDPAFGVNEMAFQVGISVSVLYRKLRALTGMTINDFMKTLRMKRALQLLESGVYHVNEVATIVGFEDSKYFSREFRRVYGKTPNEIRRQSTDSKGEG